jgi:hypothetical protein
VRGVVAVAARLIVNTRNSRPTRPMNTKIEQRGVSAVAVSCGGSAACKGENGDESQPFLHSAAA